MDREYFIITGYCLVWEHYQAITAAYPLRRPWPDVLPRCRQKTDTVHSTTSLSDNAA